MLRVSRAFSGKIHQPFHYYGLWWRHLAVQVGTTKDQGLYNKPSAAVHPGALAIGTLPQYNKIQYFHTDLLTYLVTCFLTQLFTGLILNI